MGFAIAALLGYVRLTTNPRLFAAPLTAAEAFDQVEEWLAQAPATVIDPGPRHLQVCRELLASSGTAGNLTSDAHLAALALEHGATLATFDGDLQRFAGLRLDYLGLPGASSGPPP